MRKITFEEWMVVGQQVLLFVQGVGMLWEQGM